MPRWYVVIAARDVRWAGRGHVGDEMFDAGNLQSSNLDVPTLSFVAVSIVALLGVFLIIAFLQQRNVRALAWWGSAYLIGAASMALWSVPVPMYGLPTALPAALIFVACGMIWNGVRLFHGQRLLPTATFAGAVVWVALCQLPIFIPGSNSRIALGAVVVAVYTFFIAFELGRERRKSLYSRAAAIVVPCLHASIFLMPIAMRAFLPEMFAAGWTTVFALETVIYAVGTAFVVLLLVKDHHVHVYRTAANTDYLTGLLNRRAFLEGALSMATHQGKSREPVTLMMFDLDHFKSINDRFGHGVGDDVLRLFAGVARENMRAGDILGRLGGEEFVAIVAQPLDVTRRIGERLRAGFEAAGVVVGEHAIGATVSIGAASSYAEAPDIEALIVRADAALYRAKNEGRNRFCADDQPVPPRSARANGYARSKQATRWGRLLRRKIAARRFRRATSTAREKVATYPLL
jgi:diguanylate cyclase (GGDEF)-like protein